MSNVKEEEEGMLARKDTSDIVSVVCVGVTLATVLEVISQHTGPTILIVPSGREGGYAILDLFG